MIQFRPANHSNTNRVITILIHYDKTRFQNVFIMLLRRVAKDVMSFLLSWHKRYDFNAANFRRHSQWNARYKRNNELELKIKGKWQQRNATKIINYTIADRLRTSVGVTTAQLVWLSKKYKYRGMFETQNVCRRDKFRTEWSQHIKKCKSQMGQDQVSVGVSVLCWLAAPVVNVLWKPPGSR